ncbi:MAG: cAMP-binding protein [Candidatus Collierbacteria bacterium GW2011_GWB1_44_6]|uniref:cAMP-binding protein n=2 Tax=Candidatus Collieribacteriota TaxID=1752725 RepID=A0A0G1JNP1_9BACT|nr:MAG: cAMP-binding protein [Candidatus Collierbacteria bacterium GW2011_GWC2_43_12]KKT73005.1 MAG: cAMP-binding protein [Candidatus Collierbacteria bacterium GW2011_GWB1_44_6]KKT82880.1 MAG: Transcriptional regulator, Crp/Fnr family [Microgenomates group bacterium GW2011_GWC1_44_9]
MTKAKYAQLKTFFSQFPTKKFSKGSVIFKPGDKIENVYFMKSGFVRVYTKTPMGENTLNFFKPLFLVSVMHFFTTQKNNLHFQALTSAETYVVPKSEFKKFLKDNQDVSDTIMDFFFSSLLVYLSNQGNIINGNAINKVASVLIQLVHDYGDIKNNQLVVNFPATHRIVANIVGLTRETTSVQMSKLQKLGVISTKRTQFLVRNFEKLKNLADLGE